MAEKLVRVIGSAPSDVYRKKNDDDFSDRLSSKYTVAVLVMFAIVVSMTQYVGKPIVCWTPVHFHSSWVRFTTSYCWVQNTYYLPWENVVPFEGDKEGESYKQHVTYYQWVPFILLAQAMLFYFPTVIWHAFNSRGGIDADSILEAAHKLSVTQNADKRDSIINTITNATDIFLGSKQAQQQLSCDLKSIWSLTLCRPCGKRFGNYLILLFVVSKLCYLANAVGQFFLLDWLLGKRFSLYGFDYLRYGLEPSHEWDENTHVSFPRVTMCDLDVRRLGNVNRYSVQCVLPINLYNEKIFLFLWFWMVMVVIISIANLFTWSIRFIFRGDRLTFIKNHLEQYGFMKTARDEQEVANFLDNYLKQDGAFLLRLIAHNTNSITVTEITCGLWERYQERLNLKAGRGRLQYREDTSEIKKPLSEPSDSGEEIHG